MFLRRARLTRHANKQLQLDYTVALLQAETFKVAKKLGMAPEALVPSRVSGHHTAASPEAERRSEPSCSQIYGCTLPLVLSIVRGNLRPYPFVHRTAFLNWLCMRCSAPRTTPLLSLKLRSSSCAGGALKCLGGRCSRVALRQRVHGTHRPTGRQPNKRSARSSAAAAKECRKTRSKCNEKRPIRALINQAETGSPDTHIIPSGGFSIFTH
jgi:hypothetical protein